MPTERVLPSQTNIGGMADNTDMEPEEPVKVLDKQGTFDEFVVWKHDEVPGVDDVYVKGVEEWLKLAEVVCELLLLLGLDDSWANSFFYLDAFERTVYRGIPEESVNLVVVPTSTEHIFVTTLRITTALNATFNGKDVPEASYFVARHGSKDIVHSSARHPPGVLLV